MRRRFFDLVLMALVLGLAGSVSADLVGYWKLDDGSGTVATDSSGNGNDGDLIGNPTWTTGVFGGALHFAGSADKVDVPPNPALNPEEAFTVCVWANADPSGSGHRSPLTSRDDYPQRGYIIYVEPGNTWQYWIGTGDGGWNNTQGPAVTLGEWTHVAATYDQGEKKFYINGELVAEDTATISPNTAQVLRIGAGASESAGNYFFAGSIDEVAVFNHALSAAEVGSAMEGIAGAELAAGPSPADEATDVSRDVVLSWTAGEFAATHDVYFGTSLDDVNVASRANPMGTLVSQSQTAASYDPEGMLDFDTTYYWRIDEVNAAPDNTIFEGGIWSFTTEPLAYPIETVTAMSNGISEEGVGPENTVNGSGLDAEDQHSTVSGDMWLAGVPEGEDLYIQYEFDNVYKLHEMLVWNYNVQFELILGFGLKDVTVEYSENGTDWTTLGDVELAKATAAPTYTANTAVDFGGVPARYVRLMVNSGWGMMGQYGLSEVRFLYIPAQAREPEPADGATDVAPDASLSWRSGRGAVSHDVYLGTDPNALTLSGMADGPSFDPGDLNLGTVYYWRIDEVNEAEVVTTWEGAVWSFATQDYMVVDDFESYTDDIDAGETIFDTWLDGWVNDNGSTVGYFDAPFAEQTIVHGGDQSMPLFYDNTTAAVSEAEFALDQDWTLYGIRSLSLYFHGEAGNDGQLYVKINNTKILYDGAAGDIAEAMWIPWNIDLSAVGGNLRSVTSLTIGIEGAGATGTLYIDDIRLYPQAPQFVVPMQPDDTNLVGYWNLDEGSGTLAQDSSGNGNDGTLEGTPQWVTGMSGSALQFDGSSSVNCGDAPQLALTQPLSITLWVNPSDLVADHAFAGRSAAGGGYAFKSMDDHLRFTTPGVMDHDGNNSILQLDTWQHVAVTFVPGQATGCVFYINGVATDTVSSSDLVADAGPFEIGHNHWDQWCLGMIDEVRIYDRALSAEEIAGLAGRTEPLNKPFE